MLKLRLQYFGHLMRRNNSLEKIRMLGKIEGRRRSRQQSVRFSGHEFKQKGMPVAKFLMSLRKMNGNSLQYSCLENPMDEGAW